MKKILFSFGLGITCLAMIECGNTRRSQTQLPRIAIAGLAIESSTFSPALTYEEAFHARLGDTILTSYKFLSRDSADYERARITIEKAKGTIGYERLDGATDVAKVSVIGIGMRSHAGVAAQALKALAQQKINIRAITTSEIKFSVLIDAEHTDSAVRTLHSLYGLDKA